MMKFGQQHPETQADTEKKTTGRCDTQWWCNYNIYTGQDFWRILYIPYLLYNLLPPLKSRTILAKNDFQKDKTEENSKIFISSLLRSKPILPIWRLKANSKTSSNITFSFCWVALARQKLLELKFKNYTPKSTVPEQQQPRLRQSRKMSRGRRNQTRSSARGSRETFLNIRTSVMWKFSMDKKTFMTYGHTEGTVPQPE